MIAVDTLALMAIRLNEPEADACVAALDSAEEVLNLRGHSGEGADRRRTA